MPSTQIQWFPGHMAKTRRMITENLKNVDLIIEVLDARIPYSSRNPELSRLTGGKASKRSKRRQMVCVLFKSGLEERARIIVAVAIAQFLNTLDEKPLRRIPVEILGHLNRTRLDVHFWTPKSVAGTHKTPRFFKAIRTAGSE